MFATEIELNRFALPKLDGFGVSYEKKDTFLVRVEYILKAEEIWPISFFKVMLEIIFMNTALAIGGIGSDNWNCSQTYCLSLKLLRIEYFQVQV